MEAADGLDETAADDREAEATDAGILWYGIDRTNRDDDRRSAGPDRQGGRRESLDRFRSCGRRCAEYAKKTTDDLRSRKLLEGNMDVYQWSLMISTHSQRHILQIREIRGIRSTRS